MQFAHAFIFKRKILTFTVLEVKKTLGLGVLLLNRHKP